ncbi:transglycosylase domain-containing protein [Candidatus Daviesbacteria bacterium]|nr:transglycosylase domain-containing protein [Candidatus Daviesbacteria bacterium]
MRKGRRQKTSFNQAPIYFTLLLVKIILIKIGSIPLLLLWTILDKLYTIVGSLSKRRTHKAGRPKKFRLSKRSKIAIALSAFLLFFFSYTVFLLTAAYQLPTPTKLISAPKPLNTQIFDRNNTLLYNLYEDRNRSLVNLSELPLIFIQATLASEDRNFYKHIGIDPIAILRAFNHNLKNESLEGASTLTQQLVKNSLLTPEKTYARKFREIILALWAERIYSKDEILQMYLNEAPYGGSIMGIAAASRTYFGKEPAQLTLAESAFLAGLPASPTQFSPYGQNPDLGKLRQKQVLQNMVKEGYITESQKQEALAQDLNIQPPANNIFAPHFVFYIKDLLVQKYGPRIVSQGGLKVYTSLDLNLQEKVEKIVREEVDNLGSLNVKNGAAMITDAKTGQILAMVGSRDYHYPGFGNFNVTLALRQPGSSVKPITYATAFAKGFSPTNYILDTPVVFKDEWGNSYAPVNYDGRFHGPVTLREALGNSFNIPAVKLLATVGVEEVAQKAKDLGITTFANPKRFGLSLTLGGAAVKMIDMMGVYGTFSQNGLYRQPTGILKVTDAQGQALEEFKDSPKQAILPQIAYLLTDILSDDNARKMAFGVNSLLNIPGFQVAVKTGTSDSKKDNVTYGYTPKYVVGVWVGNPDNSPMNPVLTSGITGAAPIWNKIMHTLLDGTKPLAFEKPTEVAQTLPKAMVRITKNEDKIIFSDAFSTYATSSATSL